MTLDVSGREPRTFAGYTPTGLLSRQPATGRAFSAIHRASDQRVELCVLPAGADPGRAERFLAQVRAIGELEQESLPRVLEADRVPEGVYVASAPVQGESLGDLLRDGPLPPMRVVRLLGGVAEALDAAHAVGVAHRNLGPASVVVSEGALTRSVLLDFALGLSPDEGRPSGDLTYAAPEELRGDLAGGPSDRYALACLLFQALTGAPPFAGDGEEAVPDAHLHEPPPRVTALRPELSPAFDGVVARGLAKDPRERPGSATELIDEAARAAMAPQPAPSAPAGKLSCAGSGGLSSPSVGSGRRPSAGPPPRSAPPRRGGRLAVRRPASRTGAVGSPAARPPHARAAPRRAHRRGPRRPRPDAP